MTTAIIIIAICEVIRILQNALQLMKLYSKKADKMQEKAYEELIKSLNRTEDIVHCHECKHRREYTEYDRRYNDYVTYAYCTQGQKFRDDNWFCGNGERESERK